MTKVYLVTMVDTTNDVPTLFGNDPPAPDYKLIGVFTDRKEAIKLARSVKYEYGIVNINEVELDKNYYQNDNIDGLLYLDKSNIRRK